MSKERDAAWEAWMARCGIVPNGNMDQRVIIYEKEEFNKWWENRRALDIVIRIETVSTVSHTSVYKSSGGVEAAIIANKHWQFPDNALSIRRHDQGVITVNMKLTKEYLLKMLGMIKEEISEEEKKEWLKALYS